MAGFSRSLPMQSDTDKFENTQQTAFSTLIAGMSATSRLWQNGGRAQNQAAHSSGGRKRSSIEIETQGTSSAKTQKVKAVVSQDERGLPGSGMYASETVGVGLHRKASWMDCSTAAGISQLER